ncbi:CBS domain-containing protein, partial [Reticulomyxa filosa]
MSQLVKPLSLKGFVVYTACCIGLVVIGGITSGLNVSLLAVDPIKIKLMKTSRVEWDKKIVSRIGPLVENHHLLLVTLLVANALAMEALPIFLNQMVAPWLAVLISVTFVLIFGEILPQAVFSSDPLKHGYRFACLVRTFQIILYPICMPIAWLLDRFLKHPEKRPVLFRHDELKQMIAFIRSDDDFKETKDQFTDYELNYLVKDQRTKWQDVTTLPSNFLLDENGLKEIAETGYSRIPIYRHRENNLIGICLVKDLVAVDPSQRLTIDKFVRKKIAVFYPHTSCIEALRVFERYKVHFAVITSLFFFF